MSTIKEAIKKTENNYTTQITLAVMEADTASSSEELGWETYEDVKAIIDSLKMISKIAIKNEPIDLEEISNKIDNIEVEHPEPEFKNALDLTKRLVEQLRRLTLDDQQKLVKKTSGMIRDYIKSMKTSLSQLQKEKDYFQSENINENYITQKNMLNVEALPYELSQLMKEYRASKESYNSVGTNSMVMFYTPQEKEDFKAFLKSKGINFEEIGDKDDEGGGEERFKR